MAVANKQWIVWFSDPYDPGWDFWSFSKTEKAAKEDEKFAEGQGYQTYIPKKPVIFPEMKKAKPSPK